MGNSIGPHLERAEKTGVCQLCNLKLHEFPPELLKLTKNLRTVDLSRNKVVSLPPAVGGFAAMKNFTMNQNHLARLPEEFGGMLRLESLSLTQNKIQGLPASFGALRQLKTLSLSGNRLKAFPMQLCELKNLNSVDLSRNNITEVPDGMEHFQGIELNLNQNQVSRVSDAVTDCPRLKVLRLEENCLELTAFTPRIMKSSNIALLAVEGNLFEMKNFNHLDGYDDYMERFTATKKKFN